MDLVEGRTFAACLPTTQQALLPQNVRVTGCWDAVHQLSNQEAWVYQQSMPAAMPMRSDKSALIRAQPEWWHDGAKAGHSLPCKKQF